jgi:hypothetical protein
VFWLSAGQAMSFFILGFALTFLFGREVVPFHLVFSSMYVCEVMALITHWLGHRRYTFFPLKQWYNAHTIGHHLEDYPSRKFLTELYEPAKADNSWGYAPSLLLTPFICAPYTIPSFLVSYGVSYGMLKIADHIHMSLHVRGHPNEKYTWFQRLRTLHYYHHCGDMKQNYAIGDFFFDYLVLGFRN